jgi:hydantoinase/carbamoylase family amidase
MADAQRLFADLEALAAFGRRAEGGWQRPAYSEIDRAAHDWLRGRMDEAGLATRFDGGGNLIGRLEADAGAGTGVGGALVIGSHIDTVPGGGWLDGAYGVLAGLEVARRLSARGGRCRALEIVAFRDEEGRFGAFTGSRAMAGTLDLARLETARDAAGVSALAEFAACGLSPASFAAARRAPGEIAAYLELHIEQGPVLEAERGVIGVVTAIVGQARFSLRFDGRPDHAGTTPMGLRRDAFAAAAAFASAFRRMVLEEGGGVAVGTIGIVKVAPNAGNVVPAEVRLGGEIRDIDGARLARLTARIEGLAATAAAETGATASTRIVHRTEPAPMAPSFRDAIAAAAGARGLAYRELPSGAGHDAQNFAALVPTGMIFVPSIGGRSHCPEEDTARDELVAGLEVLDEVASGFARA